MSDRPVILFDPLPRPRRQIFDDGTWARFQALGEIVGYRWIYLGGLALFTVASCACALAPNAMGAVT